MFVNIKIAGIVLRLNAQQELLLTSELMPFFVGDSEEPDVTVRVSFDWGDADILRSKPVGRDRLLIYYREGGSCYCQLDGGTRPAIAQTKYTPDFSKIQCTINTEEYDVPQKHVHQILRMLPIRQILLSKNVLFFHASQVLYERKGILFSAPSGTGKTTQARLWQQYRNAKIICNDRTLLRKGGGQWMTHGYPYDGSEPVGSNSSHPLACIVLLEQGSENKLVRLKPAKAITRLMRQAVIDGWDLASQQKALELIAAVFEDVPVYALCCTISAQAVTVLEKSLQKEGIIHGKSI